MAKQVRKPKNSPRNSARDENSSRWNFDNRNFKEECEARIKSDPEYAKVHAEAIAYFAELDRRDSESRKRLKEIRESSEGHSVEEKAETWLRFVLENPEAYTDYEALVWLASRGLEHQSEANKAIRVWTQGERRAIEECAAGHGSAPNGDGTYRRLGGMPLSEASDIENRSTFQLFNFWDSRSDPYPTEATMLRVVEWCGITGFERWWNRYARETDGDIMLGGPQPNLLILWLFDMSRSCYAIRLMGKTLRRAFDAVNVTDTYRRYPWVYGHERRTSDTTSEYVFDEDLSYAAALAWCSTRLPGMNGFVPQEAIGTLVKHQLPCGAWPHSTSTDKPCIEATATAILAISAIGHPRAVPMIRSAADWLANQQDKAGYWVEEGDPSPVRLTVLVLDALEIAAGGTKTTVKECQPNPEETNDRVEERIVKHTFNVHGPNARINLNSTDQSTNIVHQGVPFSDLRKAIESGVADAVERTAMLDRLAELENSTDKPTATSKYSEFISTAANHMTLIAPFLPALGHWVCGLLG